ncbi:MAG: hypothetical protein ACI9PC_001453, partial [Porticoccaceae bacterium]
CADSLGPLWVVTFVVIFLVDIRLIVSI